MPGDYRDQRGVGRVEIRRVEMMCYKGKTFCKFEDCKKWNGCSKAYTEQVAVAAGNWWKAGVGKSEDAPVCFYSDVPGCHSKKFAL